MKKYTKMRKKKTKKVKTRKDKTSGKRCDVLRVFTRAATPSLDSSQSQVVSYTQLQDPSHKTLCFLFSFCVFWPLSGYLPCGLPKNCFFNKKAPKSNNLWAFFFFLSWAPRYLSRPNVPRVSFWTASLRDRHPSGPPLRWTVPADHPNFRSGFPSPVTKREFLGWSMSVNSDTILREDFLREKEKRNWRWEREKQARHVRAPSLGLPTLGSQPSGLSLVYLGCFLFFVSHIYRFL